MATLGWRAKVGERSGRRACVPPGPPAALSVRAVPRSYVWRRLFRRRAEQRQQPTASTASSAAASNLLMAQLALQLAKWTALQVRQGRRGGAREASLGLLGDSLAPKRVWRRMRGCPPQRPRVLLPYVQTAAASAAAVAGHPTQRHRPSRLAWDDRRAAAQGQHGYSELKRMFEEAAALEPKWEKPYFQYARWAGRAGRCVRRKGGGVGCGGGGATFSSGRQVGRLTGHFIGQLGGGELGIKKMGTEAAVHRTCVASQLLCDDGM